MHTHLGGCSQHRADLEDLVHLAGSGEDRSEGVDLGHDAADRPEVHGGVVMGGAEEDLRGTVPGGRGAHNYRDSLMGCSGDNRPNLEKE